MLISLKHVKKKKKNPLCGRLSVWMRVRLHFLLLAFQCQGGARQYHQRTTFQCILHTYFVCTLDTLSTSSVHSPHIHLCYTSCLIYFELEVWGQMLNHAVWSFCATHQRCPGKQTEQEAKKKKIFFLFVRVTTSARRPTCPFAGGSVWAASPCPWCTPPTCWTCRRRPPVSWPSTRRTPSTAGPWMTSSYLPTRPAWQVRRAVVRAQSGGRSVSVIRSVFCLLFLRRADVRVQQGDLWVFSRPDARPRQPAGRGRELPAYAARGHGWVDARANQSSCCGYSSDWKSEIF